MDNGLMGFDPRTMGLLGAASGLLNASGPSRMPVGLGSAFSQGLMGGMQGYQQGRQIQQQEQADAAKREFIAKFPHLAPLMAIDPKLAAQRAYPDQNELFGKVDPKDYTPESLGTFAKSGNRSDLIPVRPVHFADTGGSITPLDPITGQPKGSPVAKGMTPDAMANLNFRAFEFANLSANQKASLVNEAQRIGISQQQLEDGRVQLVTDADGAVHIVNKLTRVSAPAVTQNGDPLKVAKPLTEVQGKANLFGTRAGEADQTLRNLEDKISTTGLALKRGAEGLPMIGGLAGAIGNSMLTGDQQKVEQAQRNFVNAVLRVESGAAISESEFKNAIKQYFPQPGDSKQVIEQKRANRATAIAGLRTMAGQSSIVNGPQQPHQFAQQPQSGSAMTVNWSDLGR